MLELKSDDLLKDKDNLNLKAMKINLNQKKLLLPLNYLKCRPAPTMIGEISSLPFVRLILKSRLNFLEFATLNRNAESLAKALRQIVESWNLGGLFLIKVFYLITIHPAINLFKLKILFVKSWFDEKANKLQEIFFGRMEDFFDNEEPANCCISKIQFINGHNTTYQMEIPWVERIFAAMQIMYFFLLLCQDRALANVEKVRVWIERQNRRNNPAQRIIMPFFEITNPEIIKNQNFKEIISKPSRDRFRPLFGVNKQTFIPLQQAGINSMIGSASQKSLIWFFTILPHNLSGRNENIIQSNYRYHKLQNIINQYYIKGYKFIGTVIIKVMKWPGFT
jgi:hypothetical protein